MTKDLGTSGTPAAARSLRTPWRDPRLWTGVALVAASIAIGARVVSGADDMTQVWSARADLQPGASLHVSDLVATAVHLDAGAEGRYLSVDRPLPDDRRLLRPVGQGELVPAAALGTASSGVLAVPVAVPGGAAPPSLAPGAVVDVWVAADRGEAAEPVLDDVVVLEVPVTDDLLAAGSDREVVVGVPAAAREGVGRVLAAARDGRVSITREG